MSLSYLAVWALMLAFAASAIYGLVWAIQRGQLQGFRAGARSIFDEEEPVGVPTDAPIRWAGRRAREASSAGRVAKEGEGR